jgi:pyruvate-ferredoxin/flavodoxin oxidoreductase
VSLAAGTAFPQKFGPDCVFAVFNELAEAKPKPRFTVGIYDDVTNLSLVLPENTLPSKRSLKHCSMA